MSIKLNDAVLCPDCDVVFKLRETCPQCGGEELLLLGVVLNRDSQWTQRDDAC